MVLQLAFVLVAIIIGARLGGIGLGVIFAGSSREATGHCGDCFAAGYNGKSHSAAALILLLTRTDGMKATQGSVFPAGMQAVIAIFGIAWMGDTFLQGNMLQLTQSIEGVVRQMLGLLFIRIF